MVRLRFQRLGRHNRPFYRLAALDKRTRRDGVVIENLGWFNPIEKDAANPEILVTEAGGYKLVP